MKKTAKNLIFLSVLLSLVLNTQTAFCYTLTNGQLTKIINAKVSNEIKSYVSKYSDDIKINITGIPTENIVTDETSSPKIEIISQNSRFLPNSFKRVVIKDSKNNLIKAFPVNVQTLVYKNVLVSSAVIPFNSEINSNNTVLEKREISRFLGKTIDENPKGLTSARNYPKGSIILKDSVKQKAAILKDSTVDIVFLSNKGLTIRVQGKALKEGAIGETILVRSNKYNKTYNATVNSSNEVTVRI